MYERIFQMNLPVGQSAFLWGARKTGKSTYLKACYPKAKFYDFLKTELMMTFLEKPSRLREEVLLMSDEQLKEPIILDEVQKVPMILNEVHWLIENTKAYFILCGSSARKLKRGAANLLGGRAWYCEFAPLVYPEIPDFDLLHALNNGLIPAHYAKTSAVRDLQAYMKVYMKEEIIDEGLVRKLPAFSRFLDALAFSHGQQIIYSNIARDCGVSAVTVKEYFRILVDTLMGTEVYPYTKRMTRDTITATPKFYLFDVGLINVIGARQITGLKGPSAGEAFEHYIFMELKAHIAYHELNLKIAYWRTKTGLEVDFIVGQGEVAIEVKITDQVEKHQLKGLLAFAKEHKPKAAIVVSRDPRPRKITVEGGTDIVVLPWKIFLERLWSEESGFTALYKEYYGGV